MQNRRTRLIIIMMIIITSILTGCSSKYPKISTPFGSIKIREVVFGEDLLTPPPEGYRWLVIYFNDGINGEELKIASENVKLCPVAGINRGCYRVSYFGQVPGNLFLGFKVSPGDLLLTFGAYSLSWPDNDNIFIEIPLE